MNFEGMPRKKKITVFILLLIPLLLAFVWILYLRFAWQIEVSPGDVRFSPENKPLLTGLILFALGYLFFLGLLFSDTILNLLNRRRSLAKR